MPGRVAAVAAVSPLGPPDGAGSYPSFRYQIPVISFGARRSGPVLAGLCLRIFGLRCPTAPAAMIDDYAVCRRPLGVRPLRRRCSSHGVAWPQRPSRPARPYPPPRRRHPDEHRPHRVGRRALLLLQKAEPDRGGAGSTTGLRGRIQRRPLHSGRLTFSRREVPCQGDLMGRVFVTRGARLYSAGRHEGFLKVLPVCTWIPVERCTRIGSKGGGRRRPGRRCFESRFPTVPRPRS